MLRRCLTSPFSHLPPSRLTAFVIVTSDLYVVDRPDWIPAAELITSRPWVLLRLRDHIGTTRTESLSTNLGHPMFPVEFRCDRLRFPFRTFATYYRGVPVGRSDRPSQLDTGILVFPICNRAPAVGRYLRTSVKLFRLGGMSFHRSPWVQAV